TNHHMREALEILDAWGFELKTILTWAKDKMGTGDWLRGQTEHCIMAVRGKPVVTLKDQTTLLRARAGGRSVKPREFYDLVESLCPAPRYAVLFSRYQHGERWDCHGDEAPTEAAQAPVWVENIEKPMVPDLISAKKVEDRSFTDEVLDDGLDIPP